MRRIGAGLLLLAASAAAEPVDRNWLPPGTDLGAALAEEPRQVSAIEQAGGTRPFLVVLGELAFRTPALLGPAAGQSGLACRSCHPGGDRNLRFFIPGASRHAGSFDGTTALFAPKREDGIDNPLQIPSLRGVRFTAPYGHDGRFTSLREFTRQVIVEEFAGGEPPEVILDALVAFMHDLGFLPNPQLEPLNRLVDGASLPAKRGERIFDAFCARCHIPSSQFIDRRAHDVGTGGTFDTPTLRGVALKDRLFHDGRARGLDDAVESHAKVLGIALEPMHRNDLLAYLAAIGGGEQPTEAVTPKRQIQAIERYLDLLDRTLADEDMALSGFIADAIRSEIGRLHDRFEEPAIKAAALDWAARLRELGAPPAAYERLKALKAAVRRML
jgi:hypothetical protein